MTMKKLLLAVTFLIIMILSSIPYWAGVETKEGLTQFHQALSPLSQLQVAETHYEKGWFHSQLQSTFATAKPAYSRTGEQLFTLSHQMQHGFFPFQQTTINSQLEIGEHSILHPLFGDNKPLIATTQVTSEGQGTSKLQLQAFTLHSGKSRLHWQNAEGIIRFFLDKPQMMGDFLFPQLEFSNPLSETKIEKLNVQLSNHPQPPFEIWKLFSLNLTSPRLQFTAQNGQLDLHQIKLSLKQKIAKTEAQFLAKALQIEGIESFDVKDLVLIVNRQIEDTDLTLEMQLLAKQLIMPEDQYTDNALIVTVKNLHAPTLKRLWQGIWMLQQQDLPVMELQMQLIGLFFEHSNKLLQNKPSITLNKLHFKNSQGQLEGRLKLSLTAFAPQFLLMPTKLWQSIEGHVKLSMPIALLENLVKYYLQTQGVTVTSTAVESYIQQLFEQHIFLKSGKDAFTVITIESGRVFGNGFLLAQF